MIVLHYTAMETAEAALKRLCDPEVEVSAHYLISEHGTIWRMVDEAMRAWHAGVGKWRGTGDINSRSIGIELANTGDHPFPEPQMQALAKLMHEIMTRWNISPENVIGHSDMAPARKCDPGRRFDWRRLALSGLSIWPSSSHCNQDGASFPDLLHQIGYPVEDDGLEACLRAFRQRFLPWQNGALNPRDMAIARDLAQRYGVDAHAPKA